MKHPFLLPSWSEVTHMDMNHIAETYNLTAPQLHLIESHLSKVIEANKTTNLTRIETFDLGMLLHVEDSLTALAALREAPDGLYGDMGTGGGFPGIPLAIASGRDTLLIDSVRKKIAILESIIQDLGLENQIHGYDGRIEDLANAKKETFAVLTARALSSLPSLIELASPLLMQNGRLICFKAHVDKEEINHTLSLQPLMAMRLIHDEKFVLSDGVTKRRLLVFSKNGSPKIKLPRKVGMAQNKPM